MTRFSVWSPVARRVRVRVGDTTRTMVADANGWWNTEAPDAGPGSDYAFLVDDDPTPLPDPRSRRQPSGVHGPSRVYEHDEFDWNDHDWRGRTLAGSVVYELHVGTFTPDGTFDAVASRLDHLLELGVDFIELMPVGAFPGRHGWGYDGVHPYAVHEPYGGPDGLKRLVDTCHRHGLGVLLDVVYNHLGPSGNYLPRFGPYFSDRHQTPWGPAVNLDGPDSRPVRQWIIDNARMWLRDFHLDGLRLDAVHALFDESSEHLLSELAREVDVLATQLRRPLALVAESDLNQPATVLPRECGGLGMTAQWSDDFHHSLHTLLTGERAGYYADFAHDPFAALSKTLTGVFFHDGTWSSFRHARHGAPVDVAQMPGHRFLGYLQTHDQVGNRATGDRITASLSPGLARVGAALVLTSPFVPMIFMGEEWAATTPWQFFSDHQEAELAEAVRDGRRAEFAAHGWSAAEVPDPQDRATLVRSRLDWTEVGREPHTKTLAWYRDLMALRRAEGDLCDPRIDRVRVGYDAAARWVVVHRGALRVVCNLGPSDQAVPLDADPVCVVIASGDAQLVPGRRLLLAAESAAVVRVARTVD